GEEDHRPACANCGENAVTLDRHIIQDAHSLSPVLRGEGGGEGSRRSRKDAAAYRARASYPSPLLSPRSTGKREGALRLFLVLVAVLALFGCERRADGPAPPATEPEAGSAEHYLPSDRAKPQSLPKVPPATKPTGPLAKDVSCVSAECHANLADAKQIHLPVA